ncbi:MAG: hemolysin family protein [Bacteroidales bacterium]|jgi:CBS domain containing-hemolysin-like protein|nr:hemolysin family protein [Bacteroidales bacterium]
MSANEWLIIVMLVFSGFFSGMEIAFVSSNRLKQELDLKRRILPARVLSAFYTNPSRFIGALLLGNNIALVIYGIAMANLLEPLIIRSLPIAYNSEFIILIVQTIVSTLIILITAEFIPKILFRINPNAILKFFAIPVWLFYFVFYPVIFLFIGLAEFILRKIFRIQLTTGNYNFTMIDLEEYVKEYSPSLEQPEEIEQEIQMIQNAIEFKHVKLRECMVPRTEIEAVEIDEDIDTLRDLFSETGHSKIMIYKDTIDNLVGYVHSYDLFTNPKKLSDVIRKIDVYPETSNASELLNEMIREHKSVVIVLDEFGGTSGMVTLEDIIEEIFGEIEDEHDKEETVEKQLSPKEFIFSTRLEVDYLNEKYDLDIEVSDEYETLAGFIIQHHESIPLINEEIKIAPFLFTILKSSGNRIDEVKLEIIE